MGEFCQGAELKPGVRVSSPGQDLLLDLDCSPGQNVKGLRAPHPAQGWTPDRESLGNAAHLLKWRRLGLEREKEGPRDVGQGQRPGERTERGRAGGETGASGAADPAEMSPQQEASHNIPVVWPGPGAA